ncbi:unnamed protein product [Closterium sp. NIES-53]
MTKVAASCLWRGLASDCSAFYSCTFTFGAALGAAPGGSLRATLGAVSAARFLSVSNIIIGADRRFDPEAEEQEEQEAQEVQEAKEEQEAQEAQEAVVAQVVLVGYGSTTRQRLL